MRRWIFSIVLVLLCTALPSAQAMAMSGLELLKYCKSDEPVARIYCKGYIGGILEAGLVFSHQHSAKAKPFCPPLDGVKPPQALMVVVKYLEDHPGKLHIESVFLVIDALADAFPCSVSKK